MNKPVGDHFWTEMTKAVSGLNEFVKSSGVTCETGLNVPENTSFAGWAETIQGATTLCLAQTRSKAAANRIHAALTSVPKELETWSTNPNRKVVYPSRPQVVEQIAACLVRVTAVLDYCTAVRNASSLNGLIESGELLDALTKEFKAKTALTICRGLGAVLKTHLFYVTEDDIRALSIATETKKDMWHFAREQAKTKLTFAAALPSQAAKDLARMRRLLL